VTVNTVRQLCGRAFPIRYATLATNCPSVVSNVVDEVDDLDLSVNTSRLEQKLTNLLNHEQNEYARQKSKLRARGGKRSSNRKASRRLKKK